MAEPLNSTAPLNLSDRIAGAGAQELVAMLLAGAERFTRQAAAAIDGQDDAAKAHLVGRVGAILEQLVVMLNFEEGGAVVDNLCRLYEWWHRELLDASACGDPERLIRIAAQMGNMETGWEALGVA